MKSKTRTEAKASLSGLVAGESISRGQSHLADRIVEAHRGLELSMKILGELADWAADFLDEGDDCYWELKIQEAKARDCIMSLYFRADDLRDTFKPAFEAIEALQRERAAREKAEGGLTDGERTVDAPR